MRKFKFVGDPTEYAWPTVEVEKVYKGDLFVKEWDMTIEETAFLYPDDWEKVTDKELANQDKPASEITKFEMAVFMAMQGLNSNTELRGSHHDFAKSAIEQATELFKQLENLKN